MNNSNTAASTRLGLSQRALMGVITPDKVEIQKVHGRDDTGKAVLLNFTSSSVTRQVDHCCGAPQNKVVCEPKPTLTSSEVVDSGLCKHGVVLDLGLAHWGAVATDDHELGCGEHTNRVTG